MLHTSQKLQDVFFLGKEVGGMTGNRFAVALMVLFITIIGIPIGLMGYRCAAGYDVELFEKTRQDYIERHGNFNGYFDIYIDPRVTSTVDFPICRKFPFWNSYIFEFSRQREDVKNTATNIIIGTLVIDGLVIGAYKMFGGDNKTVTEGQKTGEKSG